MVISYGRVKGVPLRIEPHGQHPYGSGEIQIIKQYKIAWARAISIQICTNFLSFPRILAFFCLLCLTIFLGYILLERDVTESKGAAAYLFARYYYMDCKIEVGARKFCLHHAILLHFFSFCKICIHALHL